MKKLLFLLFLIPIDGFSQNKKEQITTLNFKLDSLTNKISNERQESKKEIEENEKKISSLKTQINQLNSKNNNLNTKLNQEINRNRNKITLLKQKNEKLVNDFNDTISLLIKENDSLKLDSKYIVGYDLKYVPKDTDCDSIFLIEFKINDNVVFSEEVCGSDNYFDNQGPVKTFQGVEYGDSVDVVANTTYYFLNFYDYEITVCKEIATSLEVPYYFWIKNYRLDWKSNTWKLIQTIENQNEINNFINGLKLIK